MSSTFDHSKLKKQFLINLLKHVLRVKCSIEYGCILNSTAGDWEDSKEHERNPANVLWSRSPCRWARRTPGLCADQRNWGSVLKRRLTLPQSELAKQKWHFVRLLSEWNECENWSVVFWWQSLFFSWLLVFVLIYLLNLSFFVFVWIVFLLRFSIVAFASFSSRIRWTESLCFLFILSYNNGWTKFYKTREATLLYECSGCLNWFSAFCYLELWSICNIKNW